MKSHKNSASRNANIKHDITARKQAHLDVCLRGNVESGSSYLRGVRLVHNAFPELAIDDIDSSVMFLAHRVTAPLFISCMTGGAPGAYDYNKRFAEAAQHVGIPVGLGSMRVLLENRTTFADFDLKRIAPGVPLIANIGAAQLRSIPCSEINDAVITLRADAIAVHVNPAQELCQKHGEQSFVGIADALREFIQNSAVPVIVKETGCGITPSEVKNLLGMGARYVDLAGSGGTNWAVVELLRDGTAQHTLETMTGITKKNPSLDAFEEWGNPTGLLLLALRGTDNIIASGGIRSAYDVAVSVALGARMVGLALPVLRHAETTAVLNDYLQKLMRDFRAIMLLCCARTVDDMKNVALWLEPDTAAALNNFRASCGIQDINFF